MLIKLVLVCHLDLLLKFRFAMQDYSITDMYLHFEGRMAEVHIELLSDVFARFNNDKASVADKGKTTNQSP